MSIQALREQRTAKAKEMRNLLDQNPTGWTAELQAQYDAFGAEVDALDQRIGNQQRQLDIEAAEAHRRDRRADERGITGDQAQIEIEAERQVFASWLRGGIDALSEEQRRVVAQRRAEIRATMSTTTPSEGGYVVPREFAATLLEAMKAYGGMRDVATILPSSTGAPMDWPTTDATAEEGEIVAENAAATGQDASFGIKTIGAFKYSSKTVAVPFELLQDSAIDLEAHIRARLAERIARITNKHFTIGTGTGQPEGITVGAGTGKTGTTGQTTSVIYDDLVDLEHSVDPAYRVRTCRWMLHDSSLKVLKKLKDTQNRPLWVPGVAVKEPDTILSYGYTINQHMPVMAANAKSIAFGDFSKYIIRDVMAVMLLRMTDSKYAEKGQVGFLAFSRHDGKLIDVGGAIKLYVNSAT